MNFADCLLRSTGLEALNLGPQGGSINGMVHIAIYKNLAQARDPICYHGNQYVKIRSMPGHCRSSVAQA